jgi:hypothetical protein
VDVVARRLELLKLEGLGFSQAEIVKELSSKCACSERTVYNDFETRAGWQPIVQSVIDARRILLKVVNRYEQIYRQASIRLLTASNELAQLGALNTMLKANSALFEVAVLPEVLGRLKELEEKAKRVNDLSEKLKPVSSDVIRLDFDSFSEPEKQLFNKIWEIQEEYGLSPPADVIEANGDLILKARALFAGYS